MLMRKFAATAALAVAALGITAGTVNAAPAADDNNAINYAVTQDGSTSTLHTDGGSLVIENGNLELKAANGTVVAGMPLSFRVDNFSFPIAAQISDDHTATVTPQFDLDHATYAPKDVALPYEDQAPWKSDYDREQAAWNRLKDTISTGATIGTVVGGIGGAALGCVIGGVVFATATAPLATMFGAGPLAGCLIGASTVGFLGTLAGQVFVTAPVAIAAAIQYFSTINEPHIQSK
ncbi:hypothetical protein ACIRRA_06975 [Nocardia sp. NPDC101769]|uniref:hypothetical protein n=1 Tax=Nocardia sp. NPDC101769 TaxID=3364333 RepID=UPI00380675F0